MATTLAGTKLGICGVWICRKGQETGIFSNEQDAIDFGGKREWVQAKVAINATYDSAAYAANMVDLPRVKASGELGELTTRQVEFALVLFRLSEMKLPVDRDTAQAMNFSSPNAVTTHKKALIEKGYLIKGNGKAGSTKWTEEGLAAITKAAKLAK